MRPFAYVSDENYVAIPDVLGEFQKDGESIVLRSSPRGAFLGEMQPGRYLVTLAHPGFGAKSVEVEVGGEVPFQFRLLSHALLGFMWPKWVRSGEESEIRTHSREQFQLSLWRYGLKKEFVRMLGWFDEHGPAATRQITPDGDYSQTGVDWNRYGYLGRHPQQYVAAPERSGLYYLWARTISGEKFSFPWIVAPARPRSSIAVLASTNNWNAYNNFGGRSNYINPGGLPATPTVNARLDLGRYTLPEGPWTIPDDRYKPLAFERPEIGNHVFDNCPWSDTSIVDSIQGRMQCGQAPGEWRLTGWLEREGFDYDYYAEAHLHDGTLPLDSYKVLIISVHPEYWTREMMRNVKRWVFERGGRLMYLGGNGLNCEVTLNADASLMRCLSFDDTKGPNGVHESRMDRTNESEATLLGIAFTDPGVMTAAPYRVCNDSHWVFAGTNLRNGETFGVKSLHERVPGGASGHETDKVTPKSPQNIQVLAKGTNPNNGGAEMVCFETNGGAVFSVGSITWVSSLFPDEHVSKITRTVLERFLS
jgi:N,N-dimethylformamidase